MSITSTLVDAADIRFREAADVLRPHVGCFWVITAQPGATIRVVPDGSTAIGMGIENGRSSGWLLRGPLVEPDERRYTAPTTLVGVRLRPGVAFLVSGVPAHRTIGVRIELKGIASFSGEVLADGAPPTPEQHIDTLERFLIDRIGDARVPDVVANAVQEIERAHGNVRVADVAARCAVSARHLNRMMRDWVGYGPKCFARIVRFQTTLHQIERAPARSGAALASDTGYFDQAHLTQDVTRLAGVTPGHLASHSVADFSKTRCDDPL
jgi:AraC-like DNA-binding protein